MVLTFPTKNIYQFLRRLAQHTGGDRMRLRFELRRKAEQIFVISTCAETIFACVKWAGVMGISGVGRLGGQWCHSSMAKEASGDLL